MKRFAKHSGIAFGIALAGVLTWWLVDLTLNWVFTSTTWTASFQTFMGMFYGAFIGLRWEEKQCPQDS